MTRLEVLAHKGPDYQWDQEIAQGVNTSEVAHGFRSRENNHHSCHNTYIPKLLLFKSLLTEVLDSAEGMKGKVVK